MYALVLCSVYPIMQWMRGDPLSYECQCQGTGSPLTSVSTGNGRTRFGIGKGRYYSEWKCKTWTILPNQQVSSAKYPSVYGVPMEHTTTSIVYSVVLGQSTV